ncbi:hypothetical protein ACFV3R_07790 [Streptomyces sp. NPDC059740]|uniref:hypothetical protein n=1 Tax=Streptomyces sp. NPDC059740 TaxID=3346926 RepID=UPI00364E573D
MQRAEDWSAAAAFDALYSRHAAALTRQAMALSGHRRPAERAVRRAFRRAWQHWPEVAVDSDPVGWVRAAVHEAALSPWQRRHQLAHDSLWEPRSTPFARPRRRSARAGGAPADPVQRALLDALLSLPVPYRRALLLHDGLGLELPTTAAESEASPAATAGRVARARQLVACELPSLGLARRSSEERGRMLRDGLAEALAALPVTLPQARKVRRGGEHRARLLVPGVLTVSALFTATAAWTGTTTLEHLVSPARPAAAPGPADAPGGPAGVAGPGPGEAGLTGPQHPGLTQVGASPTLATASAADPSPGSGATASGSGSPGDASAASATAAGTGGPAVGGTPDTGLLTATSGHAPATRHRGTLSPRHSHSTASLDRPGATASAGTAGPAAHRSHPAATAGNAGSWEEPPGPAAVQGDGAGAEPFSHRHGRWSTPFGSAASASAPHRSRQTPAPGSAGSHHVRRPQPYASGGRPSSHHRSRLGGRPTATGGVSTTGSPGSAAHPPATTGPTGGSSHSGTPAGGLREATDPGTTVSEDDDTPTS